MFFEASFLDYIWRGLSLGLMTSSLLLAIMLVVQLTFKGLRPSQLKWHLHLQFHLLVVVFLGGFAWVACGDSDLACGCFNEFAKTGSSFTWTRFGAGLWLAIATAGLTLDLVRIWLAQRKIGNLQECQNWVATTALLRLRSQLNIACKVPLLATPERISPYAFGLWKHQIILPDHLLKSEHPSILKSVLSHELIHVRDRDSLWMLASSLCRRLLFFHPLVFLVAFLYREGIEKSADEQAVRDAGVSPSEMLSTLVELISAQARPLRAIPGRLGASRSYREIKSRMENIARWSEPHVPHFGHGALILVSAVSLGLCFAQAARAVQVRVASKPNAEMCVQVQHERFLEGLLKSQPVSNKCEK